MAATTKRQRRCSTLETLRHAISSNDCENALQLIPTVVNKEGCLHVVCQTGNVDIMKALLLPKSNVDVNEINNEGYTPLHIAILNNHLECVQLLLNDARTSFNMGSINEGNTALHLAAMHSRVEIARLLVNKAANQISKNHDSRMAIQLCTNRTVFDILKSGNTQNINAWNVRNMLQDLGMQRLSNEKRLIV